MAHHHAITTEGVGFAAQRDAGHQPDHYLGHHVGRTLTTGENPTTTQGLTVNAIAALHTL